MSPRGVKQGSKRARQYEHIKKSQLEQDSSENRAEEIAARTVNKEKARAGESATRSRSSVRDVSSGRRGGLRSGTARPKGRTREQLYNEARELGVNGGSKMSKRSCNAPSTLTSGRTGYFLASEEWRGGGSPRAPTWALLGGAGGGARA